jgi:hypothetical protein
MCDPKGHTFILLDFQMTKQDQIQTPKTCAARLAGGAGFWGLYL